MDDSEKLSPSTDDDLDPALRTEAPAPESGDEPSEPVEPARTEPPDTVTRADFERVNEARIRAETLLNDDRRRQTIEQSARAGLAPPTDPTERQYFDIFQRWLQPQLEQAGRQVGEVLSGLAERTDKAEFTMLLLRRGVSDEDAPRIEQEVDAIRSRMRERGNYLTREDALKMYEGERGRRVGGRTARSGGPMAAGDRGARADAENQRTDDLRRRAAQGASHETAPPAGTARGGERPGKPDESLTDEELMQKYGDAWI
jgi:hypothetical protein